MGTGELHAAYLLSAFHIGNAGSRKHGHAEHRGLREQVRGNDLAVVRHGDGNACLREIKGGQVSRVIVGYHAHALERSHGEAVEIGAHGGSQHYTGPVIVGEYERTFKRACRKDN
jgi:hypothetical protein